MGVHSAGARLSSHCPGGCKSRYLHLPAPSTRAAVKPLPKGFGAVFQGPLPQGATLTSTKICAFRRARDPYSAFRLVTKECTNQAESFFSRIRRAEIGIHHPIAGPYLSAYASEMAWRENNRRVTASAALTHPVSRQWKGLLATLTDIESNFRAFNDYASLLGAYQFWNWDDDRRARTAKIPYALSPPSRSIVGSAKTA